MAARMHSASMMDVTDSDVAVRITPNGNAWLCVGESLDIHPPTAIRDTLAAELSGRARGHSITRQCNAEIDRICSQRVDAVLDDAGDVDIDEMPPLDRLTTVERAREVAA
jgi:hypothetical protein